MKMFGKNILGIGLMIGSLTLSCSEGDKDPGAEASTTEDKDDDDSAQNESGKLDIEVEVPVQITAVSLGSLPTINEKGVANPGTLQVTALTKGPSFDLLEDGSPVVGEPVNQNNIQDIFALECYWDLENDNFCPDAITEGLKNGSIPVYGGPNSSGDAPYWFSNFSILGIIHHAEAYFNGSYSKDGEATKIDPKSITYKATKDYQGNAVVDDGDAGKYIIDIPNIYNRYYKGEGDDVGMHFLFNGEAETDGRYSAIPWAKFLDSYESTRNTGGGQSYLTLKEGTKEPHIYAINQIMSYTNEDGTGFRMILIINYETNHFLFINGSGGTAGKYSSIVAGKGGFDNATSTWKEGAYYAQALHNGQLNWEACVDNKTQVVLGLDTSHEKCQFVKDLFAKDDSFDPATFLGLTDTEKTDLVNWLPFFANAVEIEDEDIPGGKEDYANFPDEVQFEEAGSE